MDSSQYPPVERVWNQHQLFCDSSVCLPPKPASVQNGETPLRHGSDSLTSPQYFKLPKGLKLPAMFIPFLVFFRSREPRCAQTVEGAWSFRLFAVICLASTCIPAFSIRPMFKHGGRKARKSLLPVPEKIPRGRPRQLAEWWDLTAAEIICSCKKPGRWCNFPRLGFSF